ncbi:hypothetical protein EXIGLDRAFT_728911, partial [Exidia glandulosa HHB12029]
MEAVVIALLRTLREEWYFSAPVEIVGHLPECAIFPAELMRTVALRLFDLDTVDKIRAVAADCEFVVERAEELHVHLDITRDELTRKRPPVRRAHTPSDSDGSSSESEPTSGDCSSTEDVHTYDAIELSGGDAEDATRRPLAMITNTTMSATSKHAGPPVADTRPAKRSRTGPGDENIEPATTSRPRRPAAVLAALAISQM